MNKPIWDYYKCSIYPIKAGALRKEKDNIWKGTEGMIQIRTEDYNKIQHDSDALNLYTKLTQKHKGRNPIFKIAPQSMADHGVIPNMGRSRIDKGRQILLEAKVLEEVTPPKANRAGTYRFGKG